MKVDGRHIASDILAEVRATLPVGITPIVRAIVVSPTPATESYVRIKRQRAEEGGMHLDVVELPDDATDDAIIAAVTASGAHATIVQLPLPERCNHERIVNSIPIAADADVLSAAAYARFENNEAHALVPPVAAGVWEILTRSGVDVAGKKVAVVGRGQLVGRPCATLLARHGAHVISVTRSTENRDAVYRDADIIVSGAGVAYLVTPDMIKDGVVLIDAGTSESKGGVAGDIHPDCEAKASLFTPVPGGVGPVAVACLFKNTALLLR